MRGFSLLVLWTLAVRSGFAQIVPMGELHRNNADGTPASPYAEGTVVTVSGVVTVGVGVLAKSYFEIYLQDSTGALCVYAPEFRWPVETGDSVTVTGPIGQYRGLTEIRNPTQLTIHGKAVRPPEPLDLTCAEVRHSFQPDYSEPNESRLIRLRGVTFRRTSTYEGVLLDSTGACTIYLDPDAAVSMPTGTLDVIGILKQHDLDPPYTDGYEIVPRWQEDVRSATGPTIVEGPREIDITPGSVTVRWVTDVACRGSFRYGYTTDYELGEIVEDGPETTVHIVTLTGLTPATLYHGQAVATDGRGSSHSDDLLFCTASPAEATGEIRVYFNQSVDPTQAVADRAQGNLNLGLTLAELLGKAQFSIDACFFALTDEWVSDALIAAHRKGVKVRVIVEHDNWSQEIQALRNEGIPVIDDAFGDNPGGPNMHNKFVVIDARDHSSAADDWVWTGSYNPTVAGGTLNAENAIAIQDQSLAIAYTLEFEEMWGSASDQPVADSSRFGTRKRDNTPHRFKIGDVWVESYFSPTDRTVDEIVRAIDSAERCALFCIYSFTHDQISLALRRQWESDSVLVAGVFEGDNAQQGGSEWPKISGTGAGAWPKPADVHLDLPSRLLHHKYLIVDVPPLAVGADDPLVVTGSHNWTSAAANENDENLLIVHDSRVANLYLQEFAERYRESGGSDPRITGVRDGRDAGAPRSFALSVYPNPSPGSVWLEFVSESAFGVGRIELYDVTGRRLRSWLVSGSSRGLIRWNGHDEEGRSVPSGVYFAVFRSGSETQSIRRFVIVR